MSKVLKGIDKVFMEVYNKEIDRLRKGEEYLNMFEPDTKSIKINGKDFTLEQILGAYSDVITKLSALHVEFNLRVGREMTMEEKENKFVI